jgi:hypothetical protein
MRARNVKPDVFKNEYLAECDPLARILFIGLWCMVDREGYLEYRPKKIGVEILPYDSGNIEKFLEQLSTRGFINIWCVRTTQGEETLKKPVAIEVLHFLKHQNPHRNEKPSKIKPLLECPEGSRKFEKLHECSQSDPAESLFLESLILNHESGIINPEQEPDSPAGELSPDQSDDDTSASEISTPEGDSKKKSIKVDPPENKIPSCPQKKIIELYHEECPELNRVKVWSDTSESSLRSRWRQDPEYQTLEFWRAFFREKIKTSDFLMGRKKKFQADLGWIVKPSNFEKIMNGFYREKNTGGGNNGGFSEKEYTGTDTKKIGWLNRESQSAA